MAWDSLEECTLQELDTLEDTKIKETDTADLDNTPGTVNWKLNKVDKERDTLEDSLPTWEPNPILGNTNKESPEDTEWEFLEEWEILWLEELDTQINMEDSKITLTETEIITLTDTEITSEKSEWKMGNKHAQHHLFTQPTWETVKRTEPLRDTSIYCLTSTTRFTVTWNAFLVEFVP